MSWNAVETFGRIVRCFSLISINVVHAVETFGRIVRCFSLISINVVIYVAHAVETFGRIVRCFSLISINVIVYGVKQPMTTLPVLGGHLGGSLVFCTGCRNIWKDCKVL